MVFSAFKAELSIAYENLNHENYILGSVPPRMLPAFQLQYLTSIGAGPCMAATVPALGLR